MGKLTFPEALKLRDRIVERGWARDLIGVEDSEDRKGGISVVLAWADGRLEHIHSYAEARPHLQDRA